LNAIPISVLVPDYKVFILLRANPLLLVPFNHSNSYQHSRLDVWREPSKTAEMIQSGSSFLAKNGISPELVLINLSWRYGHRRHEENSETKAKVWIL
jgi:hypothetical protein